MGDLLYTVRPLERIYVDKNKAPDDESKGKATTKERIFDTEYGKVYTTQVDDEYIVSGIQSTCMSDYLDERYQPGAKFEC